MAGVMAALRSAEARLGDALNRVATERAADEQTLSSKVDTDVSAAQSQLSLQVRYRCLPLRARPRPFMCAHDICHVIQEPTYHRMGVLIDSCVWFQRTDTEVDGVSRCSRPRRR